MSKFSNRLRELRQSRDISMQKLSEYLGISKSSINMYERGEREPGLDMLEAIADFFNIDLDYLLGKTDIPNKLLMQSYKLSNIPLQSKADPDMFVLDMYKQLDTEDKAEIRGEIKQMLKSNKYKYRNNTITIDKGKAIAKGGDVHVVELTPEKHAAIDKALIELEDDDL